MPLSLLVLVTCPAQVCSQSLPEIESQDGGLRVTVEQTGLFTVERSGLLGSGVELFALHSAQASTAASVNNLASTLATQYATSSSLSSAMLTRTTPSQVQDSIASSLQPYATTASLSSALTVASSSVLGAASSQTAAARADAAASTTAAASSVLTAVSSTLNAYTTQVDADSRISAALTSFTTGSLSSAVSAASASVLNQVSTALLSFGAGPVSDMLSSALSSYTANTLSTTVQSSASSVLSQVSTLMQPLATTVAVSSMISTVVASATLPHATTSEVSAAISTAMSDFTDAELLPRLSSALTTYPTTAAMQSAISSVVTARLASFTPTNGVSSMITSSISAALSTYTVSTLSGLLSAYTTSSQVSTLLQQYVASSVKLGSAPDNGCTASTAGTLRFANGQAEVCDGLAWSDMSAPIYGSCQDIKSNTYTSNSGWYTVSTPSGLKRVLCDMETEGGGWQLFAVKRTAAFDFMTPGAAGAYPTVNPTQDSAGFIPSTVTFNEVLFRFMTAVPGTFVVYQKGGNTAFDAWLQGSGSSGNIIQDTAGFYRKVSSARTPTTGTATISRLHFYGANGISEWHSGTDLWVDLWSSTDSTSGTYLYLDNPSASGRKCLGGYCFLDDPVWLMWR
eukprot:m.237076 g.237076  ORF g.237076 m.237076 type:complete len:626 (+) comp22494_c0_seq2:66-1943(+)